MTKPITPFTFTDDPGAVDSRQPPTSRQWSAEQLRIFAWFAKESAVDVGSLRGHLEVPTTQHLIVEAYAGTGKTTTILEAVRHAPETRKLLCAFNARIRDELKARIEDPATTEAMTLHGIGNRLVGRYWERVQVDKRGDRQFDLARAVLGQKMPDAIVRAVAKLHTKAREVVPLAGSAGELEELAVMFDLAPDREWVAMGYTLPKVAAWAYEAMQLAAEKRPAKGIDFADMIYLPVKNRWCLPLCDLVVVDEAQDMSNSQLLLAQGVLADGGRMCLVGDPNQAIYGFRGADSDSLARLGRELHAAKLTLSVTYRCGHAIVEEARQYVPDYTAADRNGVGTVARLPYEKLAEAAQPGDFILSRMNAPLVRTAFTLLQQGKRAKVVGRDIGKGLVDLLTKTEKYLLKQVQTHGGVYDTGGVSQGVPLRPYILALHDLIEEECQRADAAKLPGKVALLLDQQEMLVTLLSTSQTHYEVRSRIGQLFDEVDDLGTKIPTVICSSVHKAKGLEAARVWALADTFGLQPPCTCGHRHAFADPKCGKCRCREYQPNPKGAREERNISYVAITRAIESLTWVDGLPPRD